MLPLWFFVFLECGSHAAALLYCVILQAQTPVLSFTAGVRRLESCRDESGSMAAAVQSKSSVVKAAAWLPQSKVKAFDFLER